MLKKIYFTVDGRQSDQRNGIKVYQDFEYDTTTNELKLVDCFDGQRTEYSISTTEVTETTSGAVTEP